MDSRLRGKDGESSQGMPRLSVLSFLITAWQVLVRLLRATTFKNEQTDRTWMFCQIR